MITRILAKILGTKNQRELNKLRPIIAKINSLESHFNSLTPDQLKDSTNALRERVANGHSLNEILPEAFAAVREAARRTLNQRHYDVQLIGGIVLHQGKIAEMKTGEGKTLTATLALYLNALSGNGSHLVTVNDYLARRDSEWMKPIYEALGLTVACLQNDMDDSERQAAYNADILYATNNELGFDYLRDNMKFRKKDLAQRELTFAIVDEVDSILIDEARTPLIISGAAHETSQLYVSANRVIARLKKDEDFEVDEKARNSLFTESGVDKIESAFHIDNLYAVEHMQLLHHVNQALRAHSLFKRDVDYVVKDEQVLIVDEFTGRILPGRRYSDGLHQALEAKEGVEIERESQTLASITLQNFFRLYKKLSGMTGTAETESEEFHNIYKLDVITIPTNRPLSRHDKQDFIFLTQQAKFEAIGRDIQERYQKKQPVLIGTVAIETSELLSMVLKVNNIPHEVLNAKQHQREAEIIEHAGRPGQVTIATNMAGRGTDIKLSQESKDAGGLYILGTERHESRRIDNQLRGRSGRQGDPGESRFYISLEDNLIRIFAGDTLKNRMQRLGGMKEDEVIESKWVSKVIENSQEKVEKRNFEMRKHLLEYDDVLNQQRIVIYNYRRDALEGEERIYELIRDFIIKSIGDIISISAPQRSVNSEQLEAVYTHLHQMTGIEKEKFQTAGFAEKNVELLTKDCIDYVLEQYRLFRGQQKQEVLKDAEKWLVLETIDQAWKYHMLNLDHLKEGIGLRSWGQKNPLVKYKKEAFEMFQEMISHIRWDVVRHVFHLNLEHFDSKALEKRREQELDEINMHAPDVSDEDELQAQIPQVKRDEPKTGRNELCPCGSEKKYKKCCGAR